MLLFFLVSGAILSQKHFQHIFLFNLSAFQFPLYKNKTIQFRSEEKKYIFF